MRHAQVLALKCEISLVHVYRLEGMQKAFKTQVEKEGNLTIYRVAYRGKNLKFIASARATMKAIGLAKKENGPISRIFLNVFFPLGAHLPWIKKRFKAPIYALEHWTGYHQNNPSYNANHKHLKLARWVSKYCKKVIGVSEDLNQSMKANGLKNVEGLVYNVVDDSLFKPADPNTNKSFKWLHISSLKDEHKNFSLLLKSFAVSQQVGGDTLTVINSGSIEPYKELIKELGISDKINFTGKLSVEKVAEIMQACDAFVLSSNYENMPCVILEALCCGLPIVSTDVGGIREVLNDKNGILVPRGDAIALTKAMTQLHNNIKSYYREEIAVDSVSKFGKQAVLKQFEQALEI